MMPPEALTAIEEACSLTEQEIDARIATLRQVARLRNNMRRPTVLVLGERDWLALYHWHLRRTGRTEFPMEFGGVPVVGLPGVEDFQHAAWAPGDTIRTVKS